MIHAGHLEIGQLVAFMDYLFHAMFSVMLFCMVFMMYPRANISAKRIMAVLNTEAGIKNPQNPQDAPNVPKHSIVFDKVDFVYPDGDEAVLKNYFLYGKPG